MGRRWGAIPDRSGPSVPSALEGARASPAAAASAILPGRADAIGGHARGEVAEWPNALDC